MYLGLNLGLSADVSYRRVDSITHAVEDGKGPARRARGQADRHGGVRRTARALKLRGALYQPGLGEHHTIYNHLSRSPIAPLAHVAHYRYVSQPASG